MVKGRLVKPEDLKAENVGKPVRFWLDRNFDNARATLYAWSRDKKRAFLMLSSEYGKRRRGDLVEAAIEIVRFENRNGQ